MTQDCIRHLAVLAVFAFVFLVDPAQAIRGGSRASPCDFPGLAVVLNDDHEVLCSGVRVNQEVIVPLKCRLIIDGVAYSGDWEIESGGFKWKFDKGTRPIGEARPDGTFKLFLTNAHRHHSNHQDDDHDYCFPRHHDSSSSSSSSSSDDDDDSSSSSSSSSSEDSSSSSSDDDDDSSSSSSSSSSDDSSSSSDEDDSSSSSSSSSDSNDSDHHHDHHHHDNDDDLYWEIFHGRYNGMLYDGSEPLVNSTCRVAGYGTSRQSSDQYHSGHLRSAQIIERLSGPPCAALAAAGPPATTACVKATGSPCGLGDLGAPVMCKTTSGKTVTIGLAASSTCPSNGLFPIHDVMGTPKRF